MAIAIHQCSKTRQLSSIARSEDEDDLLPLEDVLRPTANGTTIGPRRAGVESDHVYNSEQVKKASSRHTQRKPRPKFRYPPGWQSSDKVKSRLSQTSQSDLHIGSSCETPISMLNDRKHESDGDGDGEGEKEEDAAERNQRNRWVTLHTPEVQETQDAENIQQELQRTKLELQRTQRRLQRAQQKLRETQQELQTQQEELRFNEEWRQSTSGEERRRRKRKLLFEFYIL